MIEGVSISPLRQLLDDRGKVMHMLRSDSNVFLSFGEIYFSVVYPGMIKAWHIHHRMTLNYAVPSGNIKFVLYDDRVESPTRGRVMEIFTGEDNYCLITVPPMIWNGFKGLGSKNAIVANCASIAHDPGEIERRDPLDPFFPYSWAGKHG
jgi:dTDP-4-dehydrorhamnose 3,5-epimerase